MSDTTDLKVIFCRNFEKDWVVSHAHKTYITQRQMNAVQPAGDNELLYNTNPNRTVANNTLTGSYDDGSLYRENGGTYLKVNGKDTVYNNLIPGDLYHTDIARVFVSTWGCYENYTNKFKMVGNAFMASTAYQSSNAYTQLGIVLAKLNNLDRYLISLGDNYKAYFGFTLHYQKISNTSGDIVVSAGRQDRLLIGYPGARIPVSDISTDIKTKHYTVEYIKKGQYHFYVDGVKIGGTYSVKENNDNTFNGYDETTMTINSGLLNPSIHDYIFTQFTASGNIDYLIFGFSDVYLVASTTNPGKLKVKAVDTKLVGHVGLVNKNNATETQLGFNPQNLNNSRTQKLGDVREYPSHTSKAVQPNSYVHLHYALPVNTDMHIHLDSESESYQSLADKNVLGIYSELAVAPKLAIPQGSSNIDAIKDKMVFTVKAKPNPDMNDLDKENTSHYVLNSPVSNYYTTLYFTEDNKPNSYLSYNGLSTVMLSRTTGNDFMNAGDYKLATVRGGYNDTMPNLNAKTSKHMRMSSYFDDAIK